MRTASYLPIVALSLLLPAVAGCSEGNAAAGSVGRFKTEATAAAVPVCSHPPAVSAQAGSTASPLSGERPGEDKPGEDTPTFSPPFPDREEIFLPPERNVTDSSSATGADMMLKGFVDLSGARALLVIDGMIVPLAAGQSRGGVLVLAVDPPHVTLQRGQRRWTEALYDKGGN